MEFTIEFEEAWEKKRYLFPPEFSKERAFLAWQMIKAYMESRK